MSPSIRKIKIRANRRSKNSGKKVSLRAILKRKEKKVRLYLLVAGFLLVFFGFYTSENRQKPDSAVNQTTGEILSDSFANEPVSIDSKFLEPTPKQKSVKSPPVRIVISKLN